MKQALSGQFFLDFITRFVAHRHCAMPPSGVSIAAKDWLRQQRVGKRSDLLLTDCTLAATLMFWPYNMTLDMFP